MRITITMKCVAGVTNEEIESYIQWALRAPILQRETGEFKPMAEIEESLRGDATLQIHVERRKCPYG